LGHFISNSRLLKSQYNHNIYLVAWGEDSHLVHVCAGGVFVEGPVDRIRGVPVRVQKNYFSSADSKKSDPMWISARGSGGLCQLWHQSGNSLVSCRQKEDGDTLKRRVVHKFSRWEDKG
jgi:hypothetical protein